MLTTNATALRRSLFDTLDNVVEYNESVTVTTKKGNAVILSEEDYNAMMETIYLSSQPGLVKKIKEGDKEDPKKMAHYDPKEAW
ncbi:MAG: type II toxin-antitoxin system Phd/YefM family antitoxin [Bacilli bacterium]|jgi:PHD/YefM family antitoxin component YafN of YafNO toxin-antitoxin module|nr:type II toxin-antitoxin system Phd/YefM family antitoxin [Bacilli bacterium]MCH4210962.1 type II toxin-antitoxin system Phd/YefM family antitoxin [Bacilli bacterium]MCH4228214.1 type II toxin-antitoxin system Phd/YefM family antitoxin [Bacilli bacterium]MCH4277432.1 type II toxin-antitoxin system Phd/YefM family antitoxin [Bacilli bacterium]MCI2054666.1 type II toxin-antitoxin system Phd/YefM family antitoxin [Bacilli bacterium]